MAKSWLSPGDISPTACEPSLRLPAPHQHIVITPPREGDDEHLLTLFGDISVAHCFHTIPIPFCRDDSRAMLSQAKEEADGLLDELRTAEKEGPSGKQLKVVGGCPLKHIREVQENGTDVFIGRIWVGRDQYEDVFGKAERRAAVEENDARPVDDPSIRWTIGGARVVLCRMNQSTYLVGSCSCTQLPGSGDYDFGRPSTIAFMARSQNECAIYRGICIRRKCEECASF